MPGLNLLSNSFKALRIIRMAKIVRVLRFIRYSKHISLLFRVLRKEKAVLISVLLIAIGYIFTTALIMFNAEMDYFDSFFDALHWATTTLTTVGYGDIAPSTSVGKVISMLSALFGVAIIALPSGIITACYLDELRESKEM